MGGTDCQEEICAGDKEDNMIKEALANKARGGSGQSYQIKSRKN